MRPTEYSRPYIVMQDVAYTGIDAGAIAKLPRIGMLPVGRVVYLPKEETQLGEAKIVAFAEGLGTIAVSRNSLAAQR